MELIELKYKKIFERLDLDFYGYLALIKMRDKELTEFKKQRT